MREGVNLIGTGNFLTSGCTIEVSAGSSAGIQFSENYRRGTWGGFRLVGPSVANSTGPAIKIDSNLPMNSCDILPLEIYQWSNMSVDAQGGSWSNHWHLL